MPTNRNHSKIPRHNCVLPCSITCPAIRMCRHYKIEAHCETMKPPWLHLFGRWHTSRVAIPSPAAETPWSLMNAQRHNQWDLYALLLCSAAVGGGDDHGWVNKDEFHKGSTYEDGTSSIREGRRTFFQQWGDEIYSWHLAIIFMSNGMMCKKGLPKLSHAMLYMYQWCLLFLHLGMIYLLE